MSGKKLPTIDLDNDLGDKFRDEVTTAFSKLGVFQLRAPNLVSSGNELLNRARELFNLLESEKSEFKLDKDKNFSGYSVLKNERDFREQYHLFSNFLSRTQTNSPFNKLKLPNRAPSVLKDSWIVSVEDYMKSMGSLSRLLLKALVIEGTDSDQLFSNNSEGPESYNLLKMIHYPPVDDSRLNRTGTPPHIDWSLVTIVMQDSEPGLSVMNSDDGKWIDVERQKDCFIVLAGELLSVATKNQFRACPHKVILPESVKQRVSAPYFYSPDLDSDLKVIHSDFKICDSTEELSDSSTELKPPLSNGTNLDSDVEEHIHQVFERGSVLGDFHFGATELNRKQQGRWCYRKDCC